MSNSDRLAPERSLPGLIYSYLMRTCGLLSGIIIATLSILIVYNVISRNLGFGSLRWIMEGSEYALGVATYLGAPWVLYEGAHVRIDLLLNSVPTRVAKWLDIVINLIGAAISGTFLYFMVSAAAEYYVRGTLVFKAFVFPEWWTFIIPIFCFLMLVVEFLRRFWCLVRG